MIILSILFFITAILYSSIGFGGGSTYLALLLIWEIPYYIFPAIALICNIIVVSGNCINYSKTGNFNLKLVAPYLLGSVPFAFIGGSLSIEKKIFELLLFLILLIQNKSFTKKNITIKTPSLFISLFIGSIIGFASGIVGIGGGIFLSPILFLLKAAQPKQIATTASFFILINSISGVLGQLTKDNVLNQISGYWILFLAVLIGGQIGNYINLKIFSNRTLALATACLVIFVAIRMGTRLMT